MKTKIFVRRFAAVLYVRRAASIWCLQISVKTHEEQIIVRRSYENEDVLMMALSFVSRHSILRRHPANTIIYNYVYLHVCVYHVNNIITYKWFARIWLMRVNSFPKRIKRIIRFKFDFNVFDPKSMSGLASSSRSFKKECRKIYIHARVL